MTNAAQSKLVSLEPIAASKLQLSAVKVRFSTVELQFLRGELMVDNGFANDSG